MGSQVLSPKYHMDVYMATLSRGKVRLRTCAGSSKEPDSTLNPSPKNLFAQNNQDLTSMDLNYSLMAS
jgi:hypothetical protein